MEGVIHRNARFRTVVALIHKNSEYLFEGQVNGVITTIARGEGGFGYDPIFIADGMEMTFAELDLSIKNSISHRARAINKLVSFLHQLP
jgi:XTP/dITP diphosphohydrolase